MAKSLNDHLALAMDQQGMSPATINTIFHEAYKAYLAEKRKEWFSKEATVLDAAKAGRRQAIIMHRNIMHRERDEDEVHPLVAAVRVKD